MKVPPRSFAARLGLALLCLAWPSLAQAVMWPLLSFNERLVDRFGFPFVVRGDAAWSAVVNLTEAEMDVYLDDRQSRHFNTILVNAIEHAFNSPQDEWGTCSGSLDAPDSCARNRYGEYPFGNMNPVDFSDLDEGYWSRLDVLLDKARSRGMLVLLAPLYMGVCGPDGWHDEIVNHADDAEMEAYASALAARYTNQGNIIWVLGGDYHPEGGVCPDPQALLSRYDAFHERLLAEQSLPHLVTAHDVRGYSSHDRWNASLTTPLGLGTTYTGCHGGESGGSPAAHTADDDSGDYAFIYFEGNYEGDPVFDSLPDCGISQIMWPILGGASGALFGNNPIWMFGNSPGHPAPLGFPSPGNWNSTDGIRSPYSRYTENLWRLVVSRQGWHRLTPERSSGAGAFVQSTSIESWNDDSSRDYVARAFDASANFGVVYVPRDEDGDATTVTVDMSRFSAPLLKAYWYDPTNRNVEADQIGNPIANSGLRDFDPPGDLRVLVINDAEEELSLPGQIDDVTLPGLSGSLGGLALLGMVVAALGARALRDGVR